MNDATPTIDHSLDEPLKDGRAAELSVHWDTEGELKSLDGRLIELTRSGGRLELSEPVPLYELVVLNLDSNSPTSKVGARVKWARSQASEQWIIGFSLLRGLPSTLEEQLAASGHLERRKDPRYEVTLTATVRRELTAQCEERTVRLENYSAGGFCMFSALPFNVGERIMLVLAEITEQTHGLPAKVVWQHGSDGEYYAGCCFLNKDGTGQLAKLAQLIKQRSSMECQPTEAVPEGDGFLRTARRLFGLPKAISSWLNQRE